MKLKKYYGWGVGVLLAGMLVLLFTFENLTSYAQEETPMVEENPIPAEAVKGDGKKISIELKNVDLIEVLKLLAQKGNLNIVAGKEVRGRVTLFLEEVEIWDALRIIFEANELAYIREGEIIKVITEREYEAIYGEKFHDKRGVKFFQLAHAKVADVANSVNQLKSRVGKVVADERTNTLIVIDVPQTLELISKTMKTLDVEVTTRVFPLRFATPTSIEEAAKTILSKNGTLQSDPQSNKVIVTDIRENVEKIAKVIKEYDISPYTITKVFPLKYAKFDEMEAKLKDAITKDVGSLRADERTNTIIVTDLPSKVAQLEKIIKAYDEKTREVLIEAKVVQVTLSDAFALGINWELVLETFRRRNINFSLVNATSSVIGAPAPPGNTFISRGVAFPSAPTVVTSTAATATTATATTATATTATATTATSTSFFPHPNTSPFNLTTVQSPFTFPRVQPGGTVVATGTIYGSDNFASALNALKTVGKVNLLSSPRITAISGEEAKIAVATREAFVTNTVVQNDTVATTAENVTFIDVGVILSVTPKINPDYYVNMKIRPEVSAVVRTLTTAEGNVIPIVSTQEAESTVLVRDGVTVILGGLITDSRSRRDNRIPIFGSLPIIGPIFRNTTNVLVKDEIVIFLTPHILSGDTIYEGSWVPSQGIQDYVKEEEAGRGKEEAVVKPGKKEESKKKKSMEKPATAQKELPPAPAKETWKESEILMVPPAIKVPAPTVPVVSLEPISARKEDISRWLPQETAPAPIVVSQLKEEKAPTPSAKNEEGPLVSFYSFQ